MPDFDQRALAEALLADAAKLPGTPSRTEVLLEALTRAVLATTPKPPTHRERLLAIIREAGGRWDAKRAKAAYSTADWIPSVTRARQDLQRLAVEGHLVQIDGSKPPMYELARPDSP
ncbi:hypothetical protein [Kitasatospora mediocidica]|uniref:hypothetical protein n=1 Tax=Kitasatospora mediocidica TaxID=58352 RepID=UPI0005681F9C|nr:hypothetical protein [Kitasatospora mediocidica]